MSKQCSSFIKDCADSKGKGTISKITNQQYETCATCSCEEGDLVIGYFGCKYDSNGKILPNDQQPESCGGPATQGGPALQKRWCAKQNTDVWTFFNNQFKKCTNSQCFDKSAPESNFKELLGSGHIYEFERKMRLKFAETEVNLIFPMVQNHW